MYNNITTINPLKDLQNWYPLSIENIDLSNNKIVQKEDLYYCVMLRLQELNLSNNIIEYISSSNNIKPDQERH